MSENSNSILYEISNKCVCKKKKTTDTLSEIPINFFTLYNNLHQLIMHVFVRQMQCVWIRVINVGAAASTRVPETILAVYQASYINHHNGQH